MLLYPIKYGVLSIPLSPSFTSSHFFTQHLFNITPSGRNGEALFNLCPITLYTSKRKKSSAIDKFLYLGDIVTAITMLAEMSVSDAGNVCSVTPAARGKAHRAWRFAPGANRIIRFAPSALRFAHNHPQKFFIETKKNLKNGDSRMIREFFVKVGARSPRPIAANIKQSSYKIFFC
jgi:hypothetical protein